LFKKIHFTKYIALCHTTRDREKCFITLTPGERLFWIGLTDIFQEGTFVWTTGEKLTYTNWYDKEPNNQFKAEHFGNIFYKLKERKWNDNFNDNSDIYALCQFSL
jgi:hypothetical protein